MENHTAIFNFVTSGEPKKDINQEDIQMLIDFVREFKNEQVSIRAFVDDLKKTNLEFNKRFDKNMEEINSNLNSKG